MSLDTTRPEPAYHLGRWFALLEEVQRRAHNSKLNATIRDRFYTSASVTPGLIFPRLEQLSKHHLRKMETDKIRNYWVKRIADVAYPINDIPKRLSQYDQGLFHLGYYHQFHDLYPDKTAQNDNSETPDNERE